MKPFPYTSSAMATLPKPALFVVGWMFVVGVALLNAQSADVFKDDKKAPVVKEIAGEKNLPAPGPVDSQPSRFAGQDIEPYIAARAAVFSMRNRQTDPFGLFQDPEAQRAVRKAIPNLPSRRQAALPPTPLVDIVKLINVTTIMPSEKKFLVGTRAFKQGEEFPLMFQGKKLRMKVIEVTARRIVFRDLDKAEDASLETEMLPPGMIAGGEELRPPGMVTPEENQPLELGSGRRNSPNN